MRNKKVSFKIMESLIFYKNMYQLSIDSLKLSLCLK